MGETQMEQMIQDLRTEAEKQGIDLVNWLRKQGRKVKETEEESSGGAELNRTNASR